MQDQMVTSALVNEHQPGIAWAWMPTSQAMRHIKTVARGQACGCVCPDCGTPMVAKQGKQIAWHFAHAVSMDCQGESALHRAAKQVLEQAARCHERLPIPRLDGRVEQQDILREMHSRSWTLGTRHFDMQDASQEVRLANGTLIADVMLTDAAGARLAVEIHVTHQKTVEDAQKYESLAQDAIEIDLSALHWNANEADIREALLGSASAGGAPRHWVYTSQADLLESEARSHLAAHIAALHAQWESQMDEAVEPFRVSGQMRDAGIAWPTIKVRTPPCRDATGRTRHGHDHADPSVKRLTGEWQRIAGGWQTTGITEKGAAVDVCFLLDGMAAPACQRPTLIARWHPLSHSFALAWEGIGEWRRFLMARAEHQLTKTLDATKKLSQFVDWFREQSDRGQVQWLAAQMNLAMPRSPGKQAPAWNTSWEVWKTLVWYFLISRNQGDILNLRNAASNPWLERLTGWPMDGHSKDIRVRTLRFWFDDMASLGVVKPSGRDGYEIASKLPTGFKPWEWINRPRKSASVAEHKRPASGNPLAPDTRWPASEVPSSWMSDLDDRLSRMEIPFQY